MAKPSSDKAKLVGKRVASGSAETAGTCPYFEALNILKHKYMPEQGYKNNNSFKCLSWQVGPVTPGSLI